MGHYRLPPKKAFCHTIIYKEITGEDDWGMPQEKEHIINHAWFNRASQFTQSGINGSEKAPNASITMPYRYCGDLPDFKTNTAVSFENEEYTIVLSKPLILEGKAIGWRLEVV